MFEIMTARGWRPLHKRNYELAKSWVNEGLQVEEEVKKLRMLDYLFLHRNYNETEVKTRLIYSATQRAKKLSMEFDIGYGDFDIPEVCPLRHVPFNVGYRKHTDDSPTLDRKDPRRGYVKGNVWVISHKANRLKGNCTPNELRTFCENVLALDWVTWTSDDNAELLSAQEQWKRKLFEEQKSRWWALYGGASKSEMKIDCK